MDLCVITHPDKGHKKCILVPVGKFTHGMIKLSALMLPYRYLALCIRLTVADQTLSVLLD